VAGSFASLLARNSHTDLPLIRAMVIETTVLIVGANVVADLVQAWLDPRVR
jgi:ABC-type dipeptide/oligopeptide/nickel transport system permease component